MPDAISKAIAEKMPELVALRRQLHANPELAFEETATAALIAERMDALGLSVETGVGKTGVVAVLEGDAPGPTLLIRADIDGLPVIEETEPRSRLPARRYGYISPLLQFRQHSTDLAAG